MSAKKHTFEDIEKLFDSFLLLEDRDIVRLTMAVVMGNSMQDRKPIWLMLVAPPSSGKSTILSTLNDFSYQNKDDNKVTPVIPISDLTENTFASGFVRNDRETSLLNKLPFGGMLVFKDFTSILSKRREARDVLMSQLREIYDGKYDKHTGTGQNVLWHGKVGALAGVTQSVYEYLASMSVMGDRFIMYNIIQPNRLEMLKFKVAQETNGNSEEQVMPILREAVHEYLGKRMRDIENVRIELSPENQVDLMQIVDFCTNVRSGVMEDFRTGKVSFVPDKEMPTRMFEQLVAIGASLIYIRMTEPNFDNYMDLTKNEMRILQRIAFDSIPIKRRMALKVLAQYRSGVSTDGLAMKLGYQPEIVGQWLDQLGALGICIRMKDGHKSLWNIHPDHRAIMERFERITVVNETLENSDVEATWQSRPGEDW